MLQPEPVKDEEDEAEVEENEEGKINGVADTEKKKQVPIKRPAEASKTAPMNKKSKREHNK